MKMNESWVSNTTLILMMKYQEKSDINILNL